MTIRARHDALFKFTFSDVAHAASALATVLPAHIRRQIDFGALVLQPGSFVDESLTSRHADLLYHARLMAWLRESVAALVDVWRAPDGRQAIAALTRYILTNNEVAEHAVEDTLGTVLGDQAREVVMTTAQRLYEEGRQEGRQEGEEHGLAQAARTLLTKRFGALDASADARLCALTRVGLNVIYEEIFTATDVNALLSRAEAEQPAE